MGDESDPELALLILSRTGNEKFNAKGVFVKPSQHLFTMDEICPACGLEHKGELRGYVDRENPQWGYYIKCPVTSCKVFMRRK